MPTRPTYSKKKTASVRTVANKALSLARKAVSAEETKYTDIGTIAATVDNTADSTYLMNVAQGVAVNQRIGHKISALGFQFNYWASKASAASQSQLRIVFVQDTQQVGDASTLDWNNIFTESQVTAQRNMTAAYKRYRIIYDKTHRMDAGNPVTPMVKKYIPYKHPVQYNGTANTDIQKNGVYLLVLSNEPTNLVNFYYSIRFFYKDS